MKKKIYTTPALSVEEFEMSEIVCTSPVVKSIGGNADLEMGGGGDGSDQRAKSRSGIWDEE